MREKGYLAAEEPKAARTTDFERFLAVTQFCLVIVRASLCVRLAGVLGDVSFWKFTTPHPGPDSRLRRGIDLSFSVVALVSKSEISNSRVSISK